MVRIRQEARNWEVSEILAFFILNVPSLQKLIITSFRRMLRDVPKQPFSTLPKSHFSVSACFCHYSHLTIWVQFRFLSKKAGKIQNNQKENSARDSNQRNPYQQINLQANIFYHPENYHKNPTTRNFIRQIFNTFHIDFSTICRFLVFLTIMPFAF